MNGFFRIVLVACACIALTSAQFGYGFSGFGGGFLPTNFGGPSYNSLSSAGARDPRANTGPVVFPPAPAGDPSQTSGVVVGASGFGFVPPGSQGPKINHNKATPYFGSSVWTGNSLNQLVVPNQLTSGPVNPRYFYQSYFLRR